MIGPDKKLKLSILYPATTGRNFDEIIRAIDSLQLTATRKVATPVDWKQGGSCMVVPSVKPEDVAGLFPKGVTVHDVPSGKVVSLELMSSPSLEMFAGIHQNYSPAGVEKPDYTLQSLTMHFEGKFDYFSNNELAIKIIVSQSHSI